MKKGRCPYPNGTTSNTGSTRMIAAIPHRLVELGAEANACQRAIAGMRSQEVELDERVSKILSSDARTELTYIEVTQR